ncbi:MAG TPA: FtsX-like permease family protein, partial [Polyangiales bacterium]|nr:FtsX-like permease family protein [Polyangiales bacterium]
MLALLQEISVRHFLRTPLRSLLVVVGITLGIALYVATEAAAASMLAAFGEFVGRVSGRADLTIEGEGLGVPGELLATVADTPGVEHAASSLEVTAQATELHESLLVLGVDFLGDMHFLPFSIQEGDKRVIEDPLKFVNDPTAVLLSRRFAERHGLKQDSRLRLLTSDGPKDFFVRGVLEDQGPAASFGGQVAVMFLDAAQVSFARGTFVDRIDVAAKPGQNLDELRSKLAERVGASFHVERPDRIGTRLRALAAPLHAALWVSGFLALLVGGFLVYNAVGVAVAQRRREIGLLRALGATRSNTTLLFVAEAAVLALPGTLAGIALGHYLSRYSTATTIDALNRLYASVPQVTPHLTPQLVVQSLVAGLGMAMLAAWWPARRGAALDPAIVLRGPIALEASRVPLWQLTAAGVLILGSAFTPWLRGSKGGGAAAITLTVLGAALVTPGLVVLFRALFVPGVERSIGIPGRLGLDYVERTLGRSTVNVLALMVAVGMSVSVGGWLSSLERSIQKWASQV